MAKKQDEAPRKGFSRHSPREQPKKAQKRTSSKPKDSGAE